MRPFFYKAWVLGDVVDIAELDAAKVLALLRRMDEHQLRFVSRQIFGHRLTAKCSISARRG